MAQGYVVKTDRGYVGRIGLTAPIAIDVPRAFASSFDSYDEAQAVATVARAHHGAQEATVELDGALDQLAHWVREDTGEEHVLTTEGVLLRTPPRNVRDRRRYEVSRFSKRFISENTIDALCAIVQGMLGVDHIRQGWNEEGY